MSPRFLYILVVGATAVVAGCDPPEQAGPGPDQPAATPPVGVFKPDDRREMEDDQAELEGKFQGMRRTIDQIIIADNDADFDVTVEARIWLKDETHHLLADAKLPRATVVKLVEDLYAAGAARVYATGFTKNGDTTTAGELSIVVGSLEAEKRVRVLQVRNDFYKSYLPTIGKADLVEANLATDNMQTQIRMKLAF